MKIKKLIVYFVFFLLLYPYAINAEICKQDDIKIEKVELTEIKGNAEETSESNNENNQINVNAKMNVIGDSITYKVTIKNTSNSDYIFDQTQITKDYINYDISYEDDSNIVKAGEEKIIYLRLNYQEKPQIENLSNGVFTSNNQVSFNLINESGSIIDEIINPETRNKTIISLLIITISIGTILIIKKKIKTPTIIIIISLILIPQIVKAVCTCTLDIHLNLEIDAKEATFLPGREVNIKMKELAGDDTSTNPTGYNFEDNNITSVKYSETEPIESERQEKNIVSTADSGYPIYMWYENNTIYWWSEDKTPSLNEDASVMFFEVTNLNDISGVQNFDSSTTKTFLYLFGYCNLTSIRDLSLWNVSKAYNFFGIFRKNSNLESLDGLENWDVSNAVNMNGLFADCTSLTDISSIANWDTSNVVNMSSIFVSCPFLSDINSVANWNLSNVLSTTGMFGYCNSLTDLTPLKNWNVSNVTDMTSMFKACYSLESLNGLENWDVAKVMSYKQMFAGNNNLHDVSYINNWNISKDADYTGMFTSVPVLPEFNKINGSWRNGTFTPNS